MLRDFLGVVSTGNPKKWEREISTDNLDDKYHHSLCSYTLENFVTVANNLMDIVSYPNFLISTFWCNFACLVKFVVR